MPSLPAAGSFYSSWLSLDRVCFRITLLLITPPLLDPFPVLGSSVSFAHKNKRPTTMSTTKTRTRIIFLLVACPLVVHFFFVLTNYTTGRPWTVTIDFSSKKVNESSNKSSSRPRNFTVKSNGLQEIQEFQNILTRLQVNTTGYSDEFLRDAWSRAQDLYYNRNGEKEHSGPVIFGLETCEEFRRKAGTNAQVGLAGLFNTGTNALNTNLQNNLGIPNNTINEHIKRGIYNRNGFWTEVPWWKHNVLTSEYRNRTTNKESWMPIVMVRDPLFWLHSTCKAPYNIKWVGQKPGGRSKDINLNGKCPNPGQEITYQMIFANPRKTVKYKGLIHLWNEFYQEYLKADFPRLIVRFEDAIFHLPQIVQHIQECVGAYSKHDSLQVQAGYAKRHGNTAGTSLLKVMLKALDKQARWESSKLTLEQRQDIRRTLDPELMKILHYKMPSDAAQFTTP